MGMLNMQMDSSGRNVVGPSDERPPKGPEPMVTLYNVGYAKDTLLHINHSVIKMPDQGKAFHVPKRNAQLIMRLHGRRAGNQPGLSVRPNGSAVAIPQAPPGFRLVPNDEYDRLTGKDVSANEVPGIVPERVRILEEEQKTAVAAQAAKLQAVQDVVSQVEEDDDFELSLVSGDIPDEIIEAHNAVEAEVELDDILDDLADLE